MTVRCEALIMAMVAWPVLGQPERAERLQVGIRVIDQAGVSPEVMQQARQEVSHILRQAGVEADWLDCPLGEQSPETRRLCNQKLGPMDFWLRLATHKLPGADQDNLGAALLEKAGGGVAYAYYRDIETSARDWRCDTSLGAPTHQPPGSSRRPGGNCQVQAQAECRESAPLCNAATRGATALRGCLTWFSVPLIPSTYRKKVLLGPQNCGISNLEVCSGTRTKSTRRWGYAGRG
jgi:hypothetical protein